jgi:hypothetical protein
MLKDGFGDFTHHDEVPQSLESLQQNQQSNPWNRLPRTLLDPAAFKEVGRVNFVQLLLRWVELEPRISGVADSGYFLLGSCGRGGASEDLEHTGGRPLLTMGDLAPVYASR